MKYTGLLLAGMALFCQSLQAQERVSAEAVNAMQQEMDRSMKQLHLPNMPTPFFMSYALAGVERFAITATLGGVVQSYCSPDETLGGLQLFIGDENKNNDVQFLGKMFTTRMPADMNSEVVQRTFWLLTDNVYKQSLQLFGQKLSFLKMNPLPEKEQNLPDMRKISNVTYQQGRPEGDFVDYTKAEALAKELSALFLNYKNLFNTQVTINGVATDITRLTSEQVKTQQYQSNINVGIEAMVMGEDGMQIKDSYVFNARNMSELPSVEDMKKEIIRFADNLSELPTVEKVNEFYSGPVLFQKAASNYIFSSNLLHANGLISTRTAIGQKKGTPLEDRIGRKVIDNRVSIVNYTDKSKYNNKNLWGCYEMDAEGIAPIKELTLVENGILKRTLVGSIPTANASEATGSSRFYINPQEIGYTTAPGTVHFKVEKGVKQDQMVKQLIKAAKEEGLEYAYRIERLAGRASVIYRVDVKSGAEKRVRFADMGSVQLAKLKRLGAISREENISNFHYSGVPCSLIYPESVIVEDIELNVPNMQKDPKFYITMPTQRVAQN
ncbi:MAG: metallopeptidase TldD-related protein [Marinifilaceae bacterium]